jgi:hypothetical protein
MRILQTTLRTAGTPVKRVVFLILALTLSCSALAAKPYHHHAPTSSPWYTGPLLASSGHTFPAGHINFEPYLFYTDGFGHYDSHSHATGTTKTDRINPTLVTTYGITNWMDVTAVIPYLFNSKSGQSDNGFSDIKVGAGFQAVNAVSHTWIPDVRLTVSETFPAGKYQNLNAARNGTDAMGTGSYQTAFGVNLQKVMHFDGVHFLRTRLNLGYVLPSSVNVNGVNAYGGVLTTHGIVRPGNRFSTDLAFEYTLTRHWVPAIDFAYAVSGKNQYTGTSPSKISLKSVTKLSIAPAIEYNFTANLGLIAGVWFSVAGRNTSDFVSGVIAVDYAI